MKKEKVGAKSKILIALTIAALAIYSVAAFLTRLGSYQDPGAGDVFRIIIVTLLSFAAWYLIHNAVHELMHALFCVFSGGKVTAIAFWAMELSFGKGKKRIAFVPESGYAGWTEFVVKDPAKAHLTLFWSTLGGLAGTIATAAAIVSIYFITNRYSVAYFAMMGLVPVGFMFMLNFVCGIEGSDGRMLVIGKNGYDKFVASAMRLETESYLFAGRDLASSRPERMAELFGTECVASGYDYYSALAEGDTERARLLLSEIKKTGDNGVIDPFIEEFFLDCVTGEREFSSLPDAVGIASDAGEIDALRAHCAFRYGSGDKTWGDILAKRYKKACEDIPLAGLKDAFLKIGENYLSY